MPIHLLDGTNRHNARKDCVLRATRRSPLPNHRAIARDNTLARLSKMFDNFRAIAIFHGTSREGGKSCVRPRDPHGEHPPRPGLFDDAPARTFRRRGSLLASAPRSIRRARLVESSADEAAERLAMLHADFWAEAGGTFCRACR